MEIQISEPPPPQDFLSHYGIQGQKWGIRRFQFENGSYTPEGKERYGRDSSSDGKTGGLFRRKKAEVQIDKLKEESRSAINANRDLINNLHGREEKLAQKVKNVQKQNDEFFKKVDITDEAKERIWDKLHTDFGNDGPDDEEFWRYTAEQYVGDEKMWDEVKKRLYSEEKQINADGKKLAADIAKIAQPIIDKYKDSEVKYKRSSVNADVKPIVEQMISSNVLNYQWLSPYLFNDTAGNDYESYMSPEYSQAISRIAEAFTVEEYNRRYGKR